MKNVYKKLAKIKRPVLIEVTTLKENMYGDRFRILYPDGTCEYVSMEGAYEDTFFKSCFSYVYNQYAEKVTLKLKDTLARMEGYDHRANLKITKVQEI